MLINSGVALNDVGRLIVDVAALAPNVANLYITSGTDGDHGAVSHHYGTLSYQGSPTAAADIGGGGVTPNGSRNMRDFARWVYNTFPADVVELIHTTPYLDDSGFYIHNGVKYPNGSGWLGAATKAAHLNHVHLAMSKAGALAVKARLNPAEVPVSDALFVDVSYHDWVRRGGPLDWNAIAKSGLNRVMCARASYGDPQTFNPASPRFPEFMAGAKAAGFDCRGAYHNLIKGDQASINRQVDLLRSTMDRYGGEWAMADVEAYPELLTNGLAPRMEDVQRFNDRWYAVDSRTMVWYIAAWVWSSRLGQADLTKLRGPLINANYKGGSGTAQAIYANTRGEGWSAYGGRSPDIWQYTSSAVVPGASGNTDCNAYRGTTAQLVALLGGSVPTPGGSDDMAKLIIVTGELVDGKPADKVCVTDYSTRRWLTPEQLSKVMAKSGLPFPGERVTSAEADQIYGPAVDTLGGAGGEPGGDLATLVPHTHKLPGETGAAEPTR